VDVARLTSYVNSLFSLGLLVRVAPNFAQPCWKGPQPNITQPYWEGAQPYWGTSKP